MVGRQTSDAHYHQGRVQGGWQENSWYKNMKKWTDLRRTLLLVNLLAFTLARSFKLCLSKAFHLAPPSLSCVCLSLYLSSPLSLCLSVSLSLSLCLSPPSLTLFVSLSLSLCPPSPLSLSQRKQMQKD